MFILSVLTICLNMRSIVGQAENNNLIISDLQSLLRQTHQNVRVYLSTILVDAIIKNVDNIFKLTSLNLTTVVNKRYSCSIITTTSTSNCLFLSISYKIKFYMFDTFILATTITTKTSNFHFSL